MKYKLYNRKEYLKWCEDNHVKNPLPESRRNKMTLCGYPAYPYDSTF